MKSPYLLTLLTYFPILLQGKQKLTRNCSKATYGLHPNKYFGIFNVTFWGRSLVTRCFGPYSNSWDAYEIKGLPISLKFRNRNTELLLLFSFVSLCFKVAFMVQIYQILFFYNSEKFVNSFIWTGIIYTNLPFTYKNPIILSLLKIVTLKFTINILTILTYSLKLDIVWNQIFKSQVLF